MPVGLTFVAAALCLLSLADATSGYGLIAGALVLLGFGMATAMAPATDAIMGSLPEAKMSVGSAINDTTRVAGGALGVAVLGSLLASGYRGDMDSAVSACRAGARGRAGLARGRAARSATTARWPRPRRTRSCPGCTRRRWSRPRSRSPARWSPPSSCPAASGVRRPGRPCPRERAIGVARTRTRPPGRPRSAEADEAILRAALELLAEDGYRALTMERVRERSGVGKATLYRRYGSKEELVRAAIVHLNSDIPMPDDTGSMVGDFAATAQTILAGAARTGALTLMPRLLSEVAGDPDMHALFSEHLVEPRRRVVRAIVERAKARGEIRADVDPELAVDLMVGPFIYRLIIAGGDPSEARQPGRAARRRARRASGLGDLDAAARADAERPAAGQQLEQLLADELAAPALQRAHLRLGLAAAGGDDDRREVRAGRDQLVGQAGLLRPRAHERLGERDRRAVDGLGRGAVALLELDRLGLAGRPRSPPSRRRRGGARRRA